MRKIILFNLVTLDGFFEGPNGDIDWHAVDEEFNEFAVQQLNTAAGLIFGRVTYQMMESYWPTPEAIRSDPQVAEKMNSLPKIVFSRTLEQASWNNTRLVKGDASAEAARLRSEGGVTADGSPEGSYFIFGSGKLTGALARAGLIDEYRLIYVPVVLGRGRRLFEDLPQPVNLTLTSRRVFNNGNVLLIYKQ